MIESMACGTPVIAFPGGSVHEIVQDRVNGFVVTNTLDATRAVESISAVSRAKCRQIYESRFTAEIMTQKYLKIYERLVEDRPALLSVQYPSRSRQRKDQTIQYPSDLSTG